MSEFRESAFFDLADAFGAEAESLGDLDQLLGFPVEAEPVADDVAFAVGEA